MKNMIDTVYSLVPKILLNNLKKECYISILKDLIFKISFF